MTAKEWREANPKSDGNVRDHVDVTQLGGIYPSGLVQGERLIKLNDSAISQMRSLISNESIKKLK